jgi:hypothetical protein
LQAEPGKLDRFLSEISKMQADKQWEKSQIVALFHEMLPDFAHLEKGKYLDSKM